MDGGLLAYIQLLELIGFFSGYPLIYFIIQYAVGNKPPVNSFKSRLFSLLPYSYALLGILYLALVLRNLYPGYSMEHIKQALHQPGLTIWGLGSILFWIPALRKKPVLSLLHSLVIFFFILRDIFLQILGFTTDNDMVRNDMKIYTTSLLLNLTTYSFIVLISFLSYHYSNRQREV